MIARVSIWKQTYSLASYVATRIEVFLRTKLSHPLVATLIVGTAWIFVVWFWIWPPLPGIAICVLGALTAIMAFANMLSMHKLLVMIAIFALTAIEINDIRVDRRESDRQAADQRKKDQVAFEGIAEGISGAVLQSQENFQATMDGVEKVFSKTEEAQRTADEAIKTETGGDTFCYLDFHLNPFLSNEKSTPVGAISLRVIKVGKYPLRRVTMRILDKVKFTSVLADLVNTRKDVSGSSGISELMQQASQLSTVDLPMIDLAVKSQFVGGYPVNPGNVQVFDVLIGSFNSYGRIERVTLRLVSRKWTKAILVEGGVDTRTSFTIIDTDFPRRGDGHLDVDWPRRTRGRESWDH